MDPWARARDHDAFWSYRDRFLEFVPCPGSATLEIGCGEGRIARELARVGHCVTAIDKAPSLLSAARTACSASHYVLADAAFLPFKDDVFDRVVAYNMLMDVDDMHATVAEASRVLHPTGIFTISVVHPFTDRGFFIGRTTDAPFVVKGSYYERRHVRSIEARGGYRMDFADWSYPLEEYVAALRRTDLVIVDLCEPRPVNTTASREGRWDRMPLFCWINARHFQGRP